MTDRDAAALAIGRRTSVITLLVAGMGAGTIVQFALPALGPLIVPDVGISRAQLGALTTAFFLVGGVTSPAAGRLCDRIGGRYALALTFALGAVGLLGLGLAPSYALLLVASGIGGLAAATANPATNRLILRTVPARIRGVVVGIKQSGVQAATLLSGAVLPTLGVRYGWRVALLVMGVVVAAGAVASLLAVPRDIDRGEPSTARVVPATTNPTISTLSVYGMLMGLGIASVTTYLPVYAVEQVGLSVTRAGFVSALVGVGGILARVTWGMVADRVAEPLAVLPTLALGGTVAVTLFAVAPSVGAWALWAGAVLMGATALGWNGVAMLIAMTAVEPGRSGWATGRVIRSFYLGLVLSPVPFGLAVDLTGRYEVGWFGLVLAFVAAAVVARRRARRARSVR